MPTIIRLSYPNNTTKSVEGQNIPMSTGGTIMLFVFMFMMLMVFILSSVVSIVNFYNNAQKINHPASPPR